MQVTFRNCQTGNLLELEGVVEHDEPKYKDIGNRGRFAGRVMTRTECVRVRVSSISEEVRAMSDGQLATFEVSIGKKSFLLQRAAVGFQEHPESLRSVWINGEPTA